MRGDDEGGPEVQGADEVTAEIAPPEPEAAYLAADDDWEAHGLLPGSTELASTGGLRGSGGKGDLRRRLHGAYEGIARDVDTVGEMTLIRLRLERYDEDGDRLTPVPVEMHLYRGGQVVGGQRVAVSGWWWRGTLRARHMRNLTTGATVRAGMPKATKWAVGAVAALLLVTGVTVGVRRAWPDGPTIPKLPTASSLLAGLDPSLSSTTLATAPPLPTTAVPPVAGMSESDAFRALAAAFLQPAVREEPSATVSKGAVIRTEPGEATVLAQGTSVALVVSSGPPASATTSPNTPATSPATPPVTAPAKAIVPNLLGKDEATAQRLVTEAGLVPLITRQPNASVPDGYVSDVSPSAGTSVDRGSEVYLTVSSGPA